MTAILLLVLYFVAMVAIGWAADRRTSRDASDWWLAGRSLRTVALFFALFGTNCSPFVLMGIPGQSYHDGIAVFSRNVPIIALGIPLTFWWIGVPARAMSERLGALSPAELFAKRLDSRGLGWLLVAAFMLFTVPYMVTGIQGCGIALEKQFDGAIGRDVAAALTLAVALAYTLLGGMRATAWTNIAQGLLFLGVVVATLLPLFDALGGPRAAFERLAAERPDLLRLDPDHPRYAPRAFASWGIAITLTVVCFPHMLVRLMAAQGGSALRSTCRLYPIALTLLWTPAVLIGVFGALLVPDLVGRASDAIFPTMVARLLPAGGEIFGTLAVLAAAMSTLDAQLLTLGSMAVRDLGTAAPSATTSTSRFGPERRFVLLLGAAVYAIYEFFERLDLSIVAIAEFSFSGYVMLFPTIALALRWRRFTAVAAMASITSGITALALFQAGLLPTAGFLPVAPALAVALVVALGTSGFTRPPEAATVARAFGDDENSNRGAAGAADQR